MPESPKNDQYTVSDEALTGLCNDSETQLEILYFLFSDKDVLTRDIVLALSELYILHSSLIKYVDVIKGDSKVKDSDSYLLTSQDLYMMNSIKTGCRDLQDRLRMYNIHMTVN